MFLRVLEYYAGILFLTTNRVAAFDEALSSRIHLSLYYPQLDLQGTLKIWKNNIEKVKERARKRQSGLVLDDKGLLDYAKELYGKQKEDHHTWNGREIRNTFQSALALAEFGLKPGSAVELAPRNFEDVYQSFKEFRTYETFKAGLPDIMPKLERGRPHYPPPDLKIGGVSGDNGQGRSNSSSSSSEVSDSDRYPRLPPWQLARHNPSQPRGFRPQETAMDSLREQLASHAQQQLSDLVPRGSYPAPQVMYYHPAGPFGVPPHPQFQAMGQPSGMYTNAFSGSPGFSQPVTIESAYSSRPDSAYGPQCIPKLPQASASANDPFDWLGERTQNLPNESGGHGSKRSNAGFSSTGGRERKRKRGKPSF